MSNNSEEDLALIIWVESSHLFNSWVLDSDSSFHMSPFRDCFENYDSCFAGLVIVSSGAPCEVVDIGYMRVWTSDRKRITLTKFRHVPALGKNLILLETFDDLGIKGKFSNREVSVFKRLDLILRGVKEKSLYFSKCYAA